MLQMHYDDEHYTILEEILKETNEKRLLPEHYWLLSHGLVDEDGKFLKDELLMKVHDKSFCYWFSRVIDIMFPTKCVGEGSSDN
jgi:hypothetical protein